METKGFTERELKFLEELNYLHSKLWTGGLDEEREARYDELKEKCAKFLPID